ncbi:MAG: xanthine dehydrogenase accessory factor [Patiriisocius sp.]|jgi:xanthine dehydrogenase accessory factor
MTHELKNIVNAFLNAQAEGVQAVLATVVDLDGSSYRKPGVRMLIKENGEMVGAVSGGCVEKEVYRQALSVFQNGQSKMMTYDGRYRLGCEGILYILLESFHPEQDFIVAFQNCIKTRRPFDIVSFYDRKVGENLGIGSTFCFDEKQIFNCSQNILLNEELPSLEQKIPLRFQLIIIGAEHDAVELCLVASFNGWEVTVVTSINNPKTINDFPGAEKVISFEPNKFSTLPTDDQTAVVVMTHNFAQDLNYLIQLPNRSLSYVGLLGPVKRREEIISQLLDQQPDIDPIFLDHLYGPAGLNIGAVTPQEIATSIVAEILSVTRKTSPKSLSTSNNIISESVETINSF